MQKKAIVAWLLVVLACLGFMVPGPQQTMTQAGYQSLLSLYGSIFSMHIPIDILSNPGLRDIGVDPNKIKIHTITPHTGRTYQQEMENFLKSEDNVLIECSGMDTWHSSRNGNSYLGKMRDRAYRVVVFDGGHHLPTLGLAPDVLIVPVLYGYAVHGYMKDGIQVQTVMDIMKQCGSQTILVTVPRWRLIKNEACLTRVCKEVFQKLSINPAVQEPLKLQSRPRISRLNGQIFIYVDSGYVKNRNRLIHYCKQLPLEKKDQIHLAFDYRNLSQKTAQEYAASLQQELGVKVTVVNEAVKVSDLLRMGAPEK